MDQNSNEADVISALQSLGGEPSPAQESQGLSVEPGVNAAVASQQDMMVSQEATELAANAVQSQNEAPVGRTVDQLHGEMSRKMNGLTEKLGQYDSYISQLQNQLEQQNQYIQQMNAAQQMFAQQNKPEPVDPFAALDRDDPDYEQQFLNLKLEQMQQQQQQFQQEQQNRWSEMERARQQQQAERETQQLAMQIDNSINASVAYAIQQSGLKDLSEDASQELQQLLYDVGVTKLTEYGADLSRMNEVQEALSSRLKWLAGFRGQSAPQAAPSKAVPRAPINGGVQSHVKNAQAKPMSEWTKEELEDARDRKILMALQSAGWK